MCGIVGYIGEDQAAPILLDGLSKLEYRGYDSAGMAVYDGEDIQIIKSQGRLDNLRQLTEEGALMPGSLGIGHTRWATHGAPSDANAHPHFNENETIAIVHNGIVENYLKIKKRLESKGYHFVSETDTEVVALLLDYYYDGNPLATIEKVLTKLEGSYALAIIFKDHKDEFFAVRKDSPLIVGESATGKYIASDVPAILKYTREVCFIENNEIVKLSKNHITYYNSDLEEITKENVTINWDIGAAEKGGYQHFMLKEIYEQPKAVLDTIHPRIKNGTINIEELGMSNEEIQGLKKIYIVACGSAYHVGITGKYVIEGISRVPVEVDLASEFRYRNPILEDGTLVIIISQSGETADSLAALREAKKQGVKVLGIVNVVGSSIAREADKVMYTYAGPEIAVATTKAYSTQLSALYILALHFAKVKGTVGKEELNRYMKDLMKLPEQIQTILNDIQHIQYCASQYVAANSIFFIGRGVDYATALEGSLKLKEISYIHSEAYPAGELKHGTISLIEQGSMVTALLTREDLYKKIMSNVVEVQSRGANILLLTNEDNEEAKQAGNLVITVPKTNEFFANSLAVIPLQLLAYYVAVEKGCDVDKPRNLAKSVTVE